MNFQLTSDCDTLDRIQGRAQFQILSMLLAVEIQILDAFFILFIISSSINGLFFYFLYFVTLTFFSFTTSF